MNVIWCVLIAGLMWLAPRAALAQNEPTLSAELDPPSVEVGEACTVTLTVTVEASSPSPSDPKLPLPAGLRASPPSVSTQTQISIVNGRLTRTSGISATWQVLAPQEGVFVLGPPSVAWSGQRLAARPLRLTVHAAGSGRPRQRQRSTNPFDPFGMFPRLPGMFGAPDPSEPAPRAEPPADPELALDVAPDAKVFLRAVVDKPAAVVGEQVTLTVYVYSRVNALELTDPHEPSIPDFYRRDLIAPHAQPEPRGVAIAGVPWRVQAIYKAALFPLRAGALPIGEMQATIIGRGLGGGAELRSSEPLQVRVSEPPAKDRPVGYQVGDVGNFTLAAVVDPRAVEVGGALSVKVTLSGVGNVPSALRAPSSSSFEWLDPEVRENIDVEGGKVKGSRSFAYVVRPKVAGELDLGEVALPFWNPEKRSYAVARAGLGSVRVTANPSAAGGASGAAAVGAAPRDPWSALGRARDQLGAYPRASALWTDERWYWGALFGAPLAVVLGALGERSLRRVLVHGAARRQSRQRGVQRALADARAADTRRATGELAGALDRALHLAIEEGTGLKARALLHAELAAALQARGVSTELARECSALLASIDAARFLPEQSASLREFLPRVERATRALLRGHGLSSSAQPSPAPAPTGAARPSRPSRPLPGAR